MLHTRTRNVDVYRGLTCAAYVKDSPHAAYEDSQCAVLHTRTRNVAVCRGLTCAAYEDSQC